MKRQYVLISAFGALALAACASPQATPPAAAVAPPVTPAQPVSQLAVSEGGQYRPVGFAPSGDPLHVAPLPADQQAFARELANRRNLPLAAIEAALSRAQYNATVARLMAPPAAPESRPRVRNWPAYRARFVEPVRIRHGVSFWQENRAALEAAQRQYGVPASVIVAIIGVETVYGRNMGSFPVLDSLYTLAFSYPAHARRDRSPYFREELAEYLTMTLQQGIDPTSIKGSYAGAIGIPQFMPGSIRRYAVSPRGGAPDLVGNPEDAIASVARYLAGHGWRAGDPVFAPVSLPSDPAPLVDGGLEPTLSWRQLASAGARVRNNSAGGGFIRTAHAAAPDAWSEGALGVINLENGAARTTEYRVATGNFFVITKYNRSYFYAASVADLASELERAIRL